MNDNHSAVTPTTVAVITVVAVIALVAGLIVGKIGFTPARNNRDFAHETAFAPQPRHAVIQLRSGNICRQFADGFADSFPRIDPNATPPGNTIAWYGEDQATGNALDVTVVFPTTNPIFGGPGSPFNTYSFPTGQNSGRIVPGRHPGDYPFQSITVTTASGVRVTCPNPGDPGVHYDN